MNEISKANNSTDTGLQIGVITLGEFLSDPRIGKRISAQQRLKEIVAAARLADEAGLDVFGVGEHHRLSRFKIHGRGATTATISLTEP